MKGVVNAPHPFTALFWLSGLGALLVWRRFAPFRSPAYPADVVVRLTGEPDAPEWLGEQYAEVEARGTFENEWVMPDENHLTTYVCRHPRVPVREGWGERKHFD